MKFLRLWNPRVNVNYLHTVTWDWWMNAKTGFFTIESTYGLTQTIKTNTPFIWILNMAENSENPNNGSDELSGISWKPEARTLSDIGDDSLPCVCKLSSDGSRALPVGLSIYCQQPLYLYKRRQRKQVLGRTIYHDANGPYYEVGQTLILPDNFEG